MSNIHTLGDFEKGDGGGGRAAPRGPPAAQVNSQPLPNPWGQGRSLTGAAVPAYNPAPVYGQPVGGPASGPPAGGYSPIPPAGGGYYAQPAGAQMQQRPFNPLMMCCPCLSCCMPPCHPCSDENKQMYKGWLRTFTFWVTMVQIAYFIVEVSIGGFAPPQLNMMLGPPPDILYLLGAKFAPSILPPAWEIFRLVVPIFLHSGVIHLLFNLMFQLQSGMNLERTYGTGRVIAVYFAAGIGGNIFSCVAAPRSVGVGASGALYGLLGVQAIQIVMTWREMLPPMRLQACCWLGMVVLTTMLMGLWPLVDIYAHIGGFVIGVLIGSFFVRPDHPRPWNAMGWGGRIGFIVAVLLLTFMYVGMLSIMYTVTRASLGL